MECRGFIKPFCICHPVAGFITADNGAVFLLLYEVGWLMFETFSPCVWDTAKDPMIDNSDGCLGANVFFEAFCWGSIETNNIIVLVNQFVQ